MIVNVGGLVPTHVFPVLIIGVTVSALMSVTCRVASTWMPPQSSVSRAVWSVSTPVLVRSVNYYSLSLIVMKKFIRHAGNNTNITMTMSMQRQICT